MDRLKIQELTNMNWGSFTPEFSRGNEMVHVFNHDLSSPEAVVLTLQFITNRIRWCRTYVSPASVHIVVIDDVGQNVSDGTREYLRNCLKHYANELRFASEEG